MRAQLPCIQEPPALESNPRGSPKCAHGAATTTRDRGCEAVKGGSDLWRKQAPLSIAWLRGWKLIQLMG